MDIGNEISKKFETVKKVCDFLTEFGLHFCAWPVGKQPDFFTQAGNGIIMKGINQTKFCF
jgi:hypothetical protein